MPTLSSTALPNILDAISHLQLGVSTPPDEDKSPEEQQDFLESLVASIVLRLSQSKDVYQNFVNILDARPRTWGPALVSKLRGDPPEPPGQADPTVAPVPGDLTPNSGASSGSNWVLRKIPTDEEEPKKLPSHGCPPHTKPTVPPPKAADPIPPGQGSKASNGKPVVSGPSGSQITPAAHAKNAPMDRSQEDPSSDETPKQEVSSQEVGKPIKGILCPSKLPRKDLKFVDN